MMIGIMVWDCNLEIDIFDCRLGSEIGIGIRILKFVIGKQDWGWGYRKGIGTEMDSNGD